MSPPDEAAKHNKNVNALIHGVLIAMLVFDASGETSLLGAAKLAEHAEHAGHKGGRAESKSPRLELTGIAGLLMTAKLY